MYWIFIALVIMIIIIAIQTNHRSNWNKFALIIYYFCWAAFGWSLAHGIVYLLIH